LLIERLDDLIVTDQDALEPIRDLRPSTHFRRAYVGLDPVAGFKSDFDKFLRKIPDQPYIQGLARSANTNSLVDQIIYISKS
jgi:hypothetical protein